MIVDTALPVPEENEIVTWANLALEGASGDMCIRFVDEQEIADLNERFRHQAKPTNVLAFPANEPDWIGDIAICSPVVNAEAKASSLEPRAHYAHLVVHGVLHLRGYDHIETKDADIMQAKETCLLEELGIEDPYT